MHPAWPFAPGLILSIVLRKTADKEYPDYGKKHCLKEWDIPSDISLLIPIYTRTEKIRER